MQNTYSHEDLRRDFGVIIDEKSDNLSQFGGIKPFIEFLKKGKFKERLALEFGVKRSRSLLQFVIGVILGANRMTAIARAGIDPLVREYLGTPIKEAQLKRDFESFSPSELWKLHEFLMSLAVLDFLPEINLEDDLVIDVDATALEKYGHQEGVKKGYGDGELKNCYQYLFFRLNNINTILYGTIRSGNTHSQNGICDYIRMILPMFENRWPSKWRLDSGYWNENLVDEFTKFNGSFYIKLPMTTWRTGTIYNSSELFWVSDPSNPDTEYSYYTTKTKNGTHYKEVYQRTKKKTAQLGLIVEYKLQALAINDFSIGGPEAFKFYNGRTNIENNIRELKNDYALGKIITESFSANDAITQATLMAYLLINHFKRKFLPKKMHKYQLNTMRWHVFNIPGRILSMAHRVLTRIHNVFLESKFYLEIFQRLKQVKTWLLYPPIIA